MIISGSSKTKTQKYPRAESSKDFEGKTISKKDLPSQLVKLFDIYNTNNEGKSKNILDGNELKDLYADI